MLTLENVSVKIGVELIVKDVSFTVSAGSIVGLIGHNGAGKSTVMKTIMGWHDKAQGKININDIDQDQSFISYKKQLAYIPEEPFLLPELTVFQHFQLYGQSYQLEEDLFTKRAKELAALFEISDKLHEYPEALSKGMRQKVQTICSLLPDIPLLLIDEPFMGLDVHAAHHLQTLLIEKAKSGTSILLTSHQLERMEEMADSYVMLHDGEIAEQGAMGDFRLLSRRGKA
ncbi:ABC transporter ATP-binding protein [Gracilibacillus caseinilyticus]|uniref:ABC transporter ATP-binding protein n=1 Tax=Gracilibacillus caseinilyticus TaxID=2932256 RepID=A0ABY4EYP9_9BACI|nr:ABC transporter ATP-binding protein [Gracilibacillus caseinilyticus]UOQ49141.1 ABC transporter ATP-binding protein [Gracilibacillus caseinilyticus]